MYHKGVTLRASPPVLSMWLQTVKFIVKKSKCAGSVQEIGFSAPNSCSLLRLVEGATQLGTSRKDCTKFDLTVAQYFWLVDIMIGPGGLLLVVPTYMQFHLQFYWWGCQKKTAKLRHLILLWRVTYWALVEMLLGRICIRICRVDSFKCGKDSVWICSPFHMWKKHCLLNWSFTYSL
jgi:hypothetical protein